MCGVGVCAMKSYCAQSVRVCQNLLHTNTLHKRATMDLIKKIVLYHGPCYTLLSGFTGLHFITVNQLGKCFEVYHYVCECTVN